MNTRLFFICLVVSFVLGSCSDPKTKTEEDNPKTDTPKYTLAFNEDSAYSFVQTQVDFGPRVPGSTAHGLTGEYLKSKLNQYCDTVYSQVGQMKNGKGLMMPIYNYIGSFNPEATKRILLCAHWDTRPQADKDPDNPTTPADGANDGGSGVGVLLELARQLQLQKPKAGIDIILFDAEDLGESNGAANTWCLGSQYWSKNTHVPNYVARYGILLDMVGAPNATFAYEQFSLMYAKKHVLKVWQTAQKLGYGKHFVNFSGGQITDDHYFINSIKNIPTLNIIQHDSSTSSGFGHYWHTHKDNMDEIDKNTLKAVGETVFTVVQEF